MKQLFQDKKTLLLTSIFAAFVLFWLCINVFKVLPDEEVAKKLFTNSYGVVALLGGIFAVFISQKWGGAKSLIGRAILLFGLGLLAQELGQLMYAYYIYIQQIDVPYPSLGDIGYFGSVLLYVAATYTLFKATSSKFTLVTISGKLKTLLIPSGLLLFSYFVFLKGYNFAETPVITSLLDFGYPLLQALYISLTILVLILSRKYIGGMLKSVILLTLLALGFQYLADFSFLYQVKHENWSPGGINDLIYLTAYYLMSISILKFERIASEIRRVNNG